MLLQIKTFYLNCQDCIKECLMIICDQKMKCLKVRGKGKIIPVHA